MEWIKIDRDRHGFATDDCLDKMCLMLPIAIKKKGWNIIELACEDNWMGARGEVERHECYEYYCKLPQLPYEEDEE